MSRRRRLPPAGVLAGGALLLFASLARAGRHGEIDSVSRGANVALAANGGVATASSTVNGNYPEAAANDGDRTGSNWSNGLGGGWNDGTFDAWPDWLQIDFAGTRTISEIDVVTLRDGWETPGNPTPTSTAVDSGIQSFDVQYWNGSAWATVPGGSVVGNTLAWRQFVFPSSTTTKIRVVVSAGPGWYSRIVELEAYATAAGLRLEPTTVNGGGEPIVTRGQNFARATNGASAFASSTYSPSYPESAAIDGDRSGWNWGSGGGWNDGTYFAGPDWIGIGFAGVRTIDEIDVYTLRDFYGTTDDPAPTTPAENEGILDFDVQYWNGSAWITVPGGSVTGNTLAWRKFTFPPVSTAWIQVTIHFGRQGFSRIVEIEAYDRSSGTAINSSIGQESAIGVSSTTESILQSGFWSHAGVGMLPILLMGRKVPANSTLPTFDWTGNAPSYAMYWSENCADVDSHFRFTQAPKVWTDSGSHPGDLVCYSVYGMAPGPVTER